MTSTISAPPPVLRRPAHALLRLTATAALGAGLTVVGATAADAHVHVSPDSTAAGSYSALTFRVPDESATASTVKVAVQLPQQAPFLSVSTKPVSGWTVVATEAPLPEPVVSEGTTITRAVRTVTWTAERGSEIAPGQYQEFSVSVGPLPAPGTVLLPVVQTYSDGKVVRWDQPTPASGDEPENPAPALVVTASAAEGSTPSPAAAAGSPSEADVAARLLAGAALAVALGALGLAVVGRRRGSATGRPS